MYATPLFRIRNLTRVYGTSSSQHDGAVDGVKPSLYIPSLDIPRGRLVALLGRSGCGKTTLLETLGLMSQACDRTFTDSQVVFYPEDGKPGYDYRSLWRHPRKLSNVRLRHMSFMFQQANLLPMFNAGDNAGLARVIQGVSPVDVQAPVDREFRRILSEFYRTGSTGDALYERCPNQLSGGQQQRVTFVRAILKQSCVLFADEPTGNVGHQEAVAILRLIRDHVDETNDPANDKMPQTAVIVTHDVPLALEFADQIIIINRVGYTSNDNIFVSRIENGKRVWPELKERKGELSTLIDDTSEFPIEIRDEAGDTAIMEDIDPDYDREFRRFFNKHPNRDLSLKTVNGYVLSVMLWIVFLAIGFSKGGLDYLEDKMADPFVRWVNAEIPRKQSERFFEVMDSLDTKTARRRFMIRDHGISGFNGFALYLRDIRRGGTYPVFGRTIEFDDRVLQKLTEPDNLIAGRSFASAEDGGLIISADLADQTMPDRDRAFVYYAYPMDEGVRWVPIPVVGIVRDLPGHRKFAATTYLYDQLYENSANPFNPVHTKDLILFIPGENEDAAWTFTDSLRALFGGTNYGRYRPFIANPVPYTDAYTPGYTLRVSFMGASGLPFLDRIMQDIHSRPFARTARPIRLYERRFTRVTAEKKYDWISINLTGLDGLAALKNYLARLFEIDIDMAKVEALRNYNFVARLTQFTSVVIILISILSVSIFVSYMLYVHLYKNRIYVGAFKAFGMTDETIQRLYLRRMALFIGESLLIAVGTALLLGYTGGVRGILSWTGQPVESAYFYFDLFNVIPLLFILTMSLASYLCLGYTAKRFLDHSPGDLIYDRMGKENRTSPPLRGQNRKANHGA